MVLRGGVNLVGLRGGPVKRVFVAKITEREWKRKSRGGVRGSPIGGDDGVAPDVDMFGFGLPANFGKRRFVLLFLNNPTHSLLWLIFFSFFF